MCEPSIIRTLQWIYGSRTGPKTVAGFIEPLAWRGVSTEEISKILKVYEWTPEHSQARKLLDKMEAEELRKATKVLVSRLTRRGN